jgi:hypothetical protein
VDATAPREMTDAASGECESNRFETALSARFVVISLGEGMLMVCPFLPSPKTEKKKMK